MPTSRMFRASGPWPPYCRSISFLANCTSLTKKLCTKMPNCQKPARQLGAKSALFAKADRKNPLAKETTMSCTIHPGAASAVTLFNRAYCARCQAGIQAAVAALDAHVTPPGCFVWYTGSRNGWAPIAGTGCAHYVAHQRGINIGSPGSRCLAGFSYRVSDVIIGRQAVNGGLAAVQVNDIWVSPTRDHTGLVSRIDPPAPSAPGAPQHPPVVWITHASSAQHRLATNRFDTYFHGSGSFLR